MNTGRVEAFTDGVIAILITIMLLELPKPDGADWADLRHDIPVLLGYVLSFAYLGIYWVNHHHMFQAVRRVRGPVLWANLHLLFWLSLIPFTTAWVAEERFATVPVVTYGIVLLGSAAAYFVLQAAVIRADGDGSRLRAAIGRDWKGRISPPLYIAGIVLSFFSIWAGIACYASVALIWFIPDRRVERLLQTHEDDATGERRGEPR